MPAGAVTADLMVRLFGGVSASAGGQAVELGGPRPQAVFARLAWESGRLVTVDELVDDVWGDDPPARVRAAIQVHVSHLRAALGAFGHRHTIATVGAGYVLQLPPSSIDVLAFVEVAAAKRERAWTAADVEEVHRALVGWSGRPFAGLDSVPFVAPVVAWLEARRTELVVAAAAEVQRPDHARRLLPIVERIAVGRPLDEALWSSWAGLLTTAGHRREALNRVAELRRNLHDGAGLTPSAHLAVVERRILTDETAAAAVVRDDRPVGTPAPRRAAEWGRIARSLREHPTVTVCGPIGVVTAAIASELGRHGWVVRTVIASDRDIRALPSAPEASSVSTAPVPAATDVLVLLADQVAADDVPALAADVRARWSGPLVVVATAPSGLPDERIVRLDPLALADAVATLHDLVEAGRGRRPDHSEQVLIDRIAEATDGLDLALDVAGARLGRRRADRVLAEMTHTADYLARPVALGLAGLSPVALRIVSTLSSLEDRFDAIDAHRVLPRPRPRLSVVEDAIEDLVDAGLVHFDPTRPEPYRIPRPIAVAVRTRVRQEGVGAIPTLARMLAARSVHAATLIATADEHEAVAWFERRHVALERLAAHPDAPLVHRRAIMRSLVHTSLASGRIDVARELLASTGSGTALGHRELLAVATVAYASDEYRVVDECAARAGPLVAGDQFGVELAFRQVRALRHRCEFEAAYERLDAIAELAEVEPATSAALRMERGMTLAMEARTDEAREALARAREMLGRLGTDRGLGACWAYEAWCDLADGRVRRARPALDRSRTIAASLDHRADVAFTEVLLARLHLVGKDLVPPHRNAADADAADTDTASTLAASALDHFRRANDRLGTARALEVLADADEIRGDEDRSADSASEAEWLRAQIGAPRSPLERAVATATVRG